jgi:hypothetical protein
MNLDVTARTDYIHSEASAESSGRRTIMDGELAHRHAIVAQNALVTESVGEEKRTNRSAG